eukprot:IDg4333t1
MHQSQDDGALTALMRTMDQGDDNSEFSIALWLYMTMVTTFTAAPKRGGSYPGKKGNEERYFTDSHNRYMVKYFWPRDELRPFNPSLPGSLPRYGPTASEKSFERRFRMPRAVFDRIFQVVVQHSAYFRQGLRPDATGRLGISPLIKVITALRQLAYGIPSDMCDDMFEVSETTARTCMKELCRTIVSVLSAEYLRDPTAEDTERIEKKFRAVGFPGCIGAVDCAGWVWKNAPKAMQRSLVGKDGVPVLRSEVICDLDLWIWSFQFGLPGVLNDIDILDLSDHFCKMLTGAFPPVLPNYKIGNETFNHFYYLADGIYPNWKVFCKTLSDPHLDKEQVYSKAQEGVRKCVERVFGVLFTQFKMLFTPCQLWSSAEMGVIARACVIMHNMVAEVRCDEYAGDGGRGLSRHFNEADDVTDLQMVPASTNAIERLQQMAPVYEQLEAPHEMHRLWGALIDHLWYRKGISEIYK